MKLPLRFFVLPALLLVAGGLVWPRFCRAAPESPAAQPLLKTARPAQRSFSRSVPWTGRVAARVSLTLLAQTDGRVVALPVADQAKVAKGQLVARLGGAQLASRQAGLKERETSLSAQLDLNRQSLDRLQQGLQDQLATKDQLAAAQQDRIRLESELHQAYLDSEALDRQRRILAPAAGIFTGRRVSVGQQVKAGDELGRIIDPGRLRIEAALFPPQGTQLQGRPVTIRLAGGQLVSGRISAVLPEADASGAVQVWIEGFPVDGRLRPGQAVGGELVQDAGESLAVPEGAIVYDDAERPGLFVAAGQDYRYRRVELGLSQDGWVQVRSGLSPEQTVVIQGGYELYYRQFSRQFKVPD